ncbi:nuclear transport factor 2 family protein [Aquimarina hainanensis]|uniref:Nuclear transport factor 2 family protein n=1 Tax=Aquimarina hainanensis TaxID=1578017 RepID=A0ABW5NEZ1_9FLAO
MKRYCVIISMFFTGVIIGQKNGTMDNVATYKKEVKQTIVEFFEGFHKGDTSIIRKTIDQDITLKTVIKTKEGSYSTRSTNVSDFMRVIHEMAQKSRWNERLLLFKIEADKQLATAWTPYEFYLNDTFSHCGINTFQLYHDGTRWKILSVVDTRKKEDCQ